LSAELIDPAALVVAAEIEIAGVVPPEETMGAVPLTEATAAPAVIPSSFVLSAEDMDPAAEVVAAEIEIAGVVPPEETIGAVPDTEATAAPAVIPASLLRSAEVKKRFVVPSGRSSESPSSSATFRAWKGASKVEALYTGTCPDTVPREAGRSYVDPEAPTRRAGNKERASPIVAAVTPATVMTALFVELSMTILFEESTWTVVVFAVLSSRALIPVMSPSIAVRSASTLSPEDPVRQMSAESKTTVPVWPFTEETEPAATIAVAKVETVTFLFVPLKLMVVSLTSTTIKRSLFAGVVVSSVSWEVLRVAMTLNVSFDFCEVHQAPLG